MRRVLVAFLVVAVTSFAAGCDDVARFWNTSVIGKIEPEPGTTWIVLLDLSGTAKKYRGEYLEDLSALVQSASGYGDRWVVYPIDKDTIINGQAIAEVTIPQFRTEQTNPRNVLREREAHVAENPLETYQSQIIGALREALTTETVTAGSDLMGGFRLASQVVSRQRSMAAGAPDSVPEQRYCVIVASDGLVQDDLTDLARPGFDPAAEFQKIKAAGRVANLSGVRVVFTGATGLDTTHREAVRQFWTLYLTEAGAVFREEEDYGRRLPKDLIEELGSQRVTLEESD